MAALGREEAEELAATVASVDADNPDNFFALVARRLEAKGVKFPSVNIEYRISCTVCATSSASALPSLPNVAKSILKTLTFQRPRQESLTILNDVSGSLRPGCLTLLLGPPSCGKTTLLRALAGRLDPKEYTGYVKYNGVNVSDFDTSRSAVFVAQTDAHIPNLTARETVKFAFDIQQGDSGTAFSTTKASTEPSVSAAQLSKVVTDSADNRSLSALSPADLEGLERDALNGPARVDTLMQLFALMRCKDTFVGNIEMRGLSGGERKRLSTVEMITGKQRVLVLDEISTGLDAATLYRIIRWLRAMTHHLQLTVIVSLLQPPPETFALFDDLMLMNEGHIVYHGYVSGAVPFMTSAGLELPPRKDVPSFLQEVTTVRGQILYASPSLRASRSMPQSVYEVDDIELSQMSRFISLQEFSKLSPSADVEPAKAQPALGGPGDGALIPKSEKRSLTFMQQLALVLGRQKTLFLRDPTLVRARIGQSIILGLIIGGLWFQLDVSLADSRTFMSSCFMTTLFFAFGGMPQMSVALNNRNVWFKHRESSLYSATVYAWSQGLVQLPVSIIEAFLFSSITYFMIGFSLDSAQYYFSFVVVNLTTSLAVTSLFRLIGSAFRSLTSAQGIGGFILLLLIINSGFIILRTSIPAWIVYFYWVSPFAYGIRSLVVNEFTSPRWDVVSPIPGKSLGDVALENFDFFTDRYWVWVGVAFNCGLFVLLTQLSAVFLALAKAPRRAATTRSNEEIIETLKQAKNMRAEAQKLLCDSHAVQNGGTKNGAANNGAAKNQEEPSSAPSSMRRGTSSLGVASALKFTPITVAWRNLSYYVAVPKGLKGAAALNVMPADAPEDIAGKKRLLNDITGYACPGTLCALMGGTGAGKTTLMDVLAGRKTQGVIKGDLMINGYPKQQDTWARVVGYVEQTDVHSASLTVLESLQFSAGLRLTDDVDSRLRQAYILEVLLVTELLDIKGALVGTPGESGLSVEQRRRLSIGVELVANPSVMFMDEPTSGLDARSAAAVIEAVRNVAANGRTVMVTIHQPSIEIFEAFDRLVLLAQGGEPIFCGPIGHHSSCLISYFEGVPGVAPLPEGYNPATWMLEVSGGASEKTSMAVSAEQFPERYRASDLLATTKSRVDELISSGASKHEPLSLASRYAVPFVQQTKMVTWKMFIVYWRFPEYTVSRIIISIVTALIFGLTWWNEGSLDAGTPTDVRRVQNIIGMLYSGLSFMGMGNLISGMPAFFAERQVMYRERASSMYAILPFGIATGVVEIPYLIAQSLLFIPIMYPMIGFRASFDAVALFFVIYTQSLALYTFMGQFFAYLAPTMPIATVLGGLNHFIWNIFNGFLVPNPAMARGWLWLNYISATTWVIRALAASQLGLEDNPLVIPGQPDWPACSPSNTAACPTVREYLDTAFGYEYSFRWWCALILMVFVTVFRIGAMLVLKAVRHETR